MPRVVARIHQKSNLDIDHKNSAINVMLESGIRLSHCPETLVLYRMRPTVSMQVGSVLRGASDTAV